jgi:hypothetical protein
MPRPNFPHVLHFEQQELMMVTSTRTELIHMAEGKYRHLVTVSLRYTSIVERNCRV